MSNIISPTKSDGKIEFFLFDDKESIKNCTLVTGFYGIGKVGFIAINHMVQRLNAKLIGYIISEYLPPFLSVKDNRLVLPFEIYKFENVIFITSYFEPYKYEHRAFARSIVDWAISKELQRLVLIGGLDSRLKVEDDILAKAVITRKYKNELTKPNIPDLDEGLYITGPMALILMYSEALNFASLGILPYAERSRPDPIAASHAVEIINDLLGLDCGIDELVREAETIESELQSLEDLMQEDDKESSKNQGMFL